MTPQQFIEETERQLLELLEKQGVKENGIDEAAHQICTEQKEFYRSRLLALIELRDKELRERIEGMRRHFKSRDIDLSECENTEVAYTAMHSRTDGFNSAIKEVLSLLNLMKK